METFVLTEDHVKLAQAMYVSWQDCETGAPAINPKRPYGNSDVASDIKDILGLSRNECSNCGHCEDDDDDSINEAMDLHREMDTALQIILLNMTFTPGTYAKKGRYDDRSWTLQ